MLGDREDEAILTSDEHASWSFTQLLIKPHAEFTVGNIPLQFGCRINTAKGKGPFRLRSGLCGYRNSTRSRDTRCRVNSTIFVQ